MTKDIAKVQEYAIMQKGQMDKIKEMMAENLGEDAKITFSDLPRISCPSGKSTTWLIPDIEAAGGVIETKAITGIIMMTQSTRQYWEVSFDESGGGTPPDCSSEDAVTGRGNPGGDCINCILSEFDQDTGRQRCKESRLIFMITPDDILPIMISAPPTSLKNVRKYLMGLISKQKYAYTAYTELTLETDKSQGGIHYPKINIRKIGEVEKPEVSKAYSKMLKPHLVREARRVSEEGE